MQRVSINHYNTHNIEEIHYPAPKSGKKLFLNTYGRFLGILLIAKSKEYINIKQMSREREDDDSEE